MKFDKNGIEELKKLIEEQDKKVVEANHKVGEAFQGDTNTWHDNAAYDYADNQRHGATAMRAHYVEVLRNAELVEAHGDSEKVDIGSFVKLFDYDFDEELNIVLSGGYESKELDNGVQVITLNSPLGEAIWGAKKGQDVSYMVRDNKIVVKVVDFKNPTIEASDDEEKQV